MNFWRNLLGIKKKDFKTLKITVPEHNIFVYSDRSKFPYPTLRDKPAYWMSQSGDIHIEGKMQDDGMIDVPDGVLGHEEQHTLHALRREQIAHPHKDES